MKLGLASLRERGFYPRTIIDVGAFEGGWSRMAKTVWPDSCFVMIEPNKSPKLDATAKEISATLYYCLLGATDKETVTFYYMKKGSSVLQERSSVPPHQPR